jgi:hypothetical protein
LYESGLTIKEVGKKLDSKYTTIITFMQRNNIPRRSRRNNKKQE